MTYKDYIVFDHQIMLGKPIIKGTRLTVELILRKLGEGATSQDLMLMYPNLSEKAIRAVMFFVADLVANDEYLETAA